MELGILGPLEVSEAGQTLGLPGARQRALLALLALEAGRAVSVDRLIEELWGPAAPDTAKAIVQVYVSRLRKALPDGALVTQAPGYRLALEPARIDAHRFERLYEQALECRAGGDTAAASRLLHDALGLWRGPALADFAYENFAQAEIARLEELRMAALEARIDADLELGRHAEVAGELEALVATHPLRERLRALQMLALYRCGRQADALAAYRDARATLVDELGIEPSPALQRLERDILSQDPALEPAGPQAARPAPAADELPAEEQARKLVTMLLSEIVESRLAEESSPERRRRLLERVFERASDVIVRHGGTVDAIAGETVSAVFGVPAAHEDDAPRALRAALDLRSEMADLNVELHERWGLRVGVRTGVATGDAVVAGAGAGPRIATGASTVARRLQQAAAPAEILVGERTAAAARGAFELTGPETVTAGGDRRGVPAWRLVRALSWTRPTRATGAGPVFVGRAAELGVLRDAYARTVAQRRAQLVTVVGEPGVGKTTLMAALRERLAGRPPAPAFHVGRCPAYGSGITYWPLGEILRAELGLRAGDPPEVVRERLAGRDILGVSLGLDAPGDVHPATAREHLHDAWVALLEELVADQPLLALIEDLHSAQDPLLDAIEHVAGSVRGPLMLVVTTRPELLERRPAWGTDDGSMLRLEPLGAADAERLLESLGGADLPAGVRTTLLDRCGGNPFFLEETLAALIDAGGDLAIPDSVQALLAARMDLLGPAERAALQTAAVIGRTFSEAPVRRLLGDVDPDFDTLEARGFVQRRPSVAAGNAREYAFKHALTCDVARRALPSERRARMHAAFAAWLEEAGGAADSAPLIAHHYAESVRPDEADVAWESGDAEAARLRAKAVTWLRRAAESSTARCAVDEAVGALSRALELEPDAAGQAELWRAIARAAAIGYDGERFYPAMRRAIALSSDPDLLADLYSELALQTTIRPAMWVSEPDREEVGGAIERALNLTEGGRTPARVRALVASACADPSRGGPAAREASRLADRVAGAELRAQARGAEFKTAFATGRLDEALAAAHRRLELEPAVADPEERAFMHWDLALAHLALGRIDDAVAEARLHDEMVAPLSAHHAVHGVGMLLMVYELAGRWEAVRELRPAVERAVGANPAAGCVFNPRSLYACALAEARGGDGRSADALEDAADALVHPGHGLTALAPRLRLALLRDDLEKVERILAEPAEAMYFAWLDAQAVRLDALAAIGDSAGVESLTAPMPATGTYLEPFALRALAVVRGDGELLARAAERFAALGLQSHAGDTRALVSAA